MWDATYERAHRDMNVTYNQDKHFKYQQQQSEKKNKTIVFGSVFTLLAFLLYYFVFSSTSSHTTTVQEVCRDECEKKTFDCTRTCEPFKNMDDKYPQCLSGCVRRYHDACVRGCAATSVEQCIESDEECRGKMCPIFLIVVKNACGKSVKRFTELALEAASR
jgi:hypothetical protein